MGMAVWDGRQWVGPGKSAGLIQIKKGIRARTNSVTDAATASILAESELDDGGTFYATRYKIVIKSRRVIWERCDQEEATRALSAIDEVAGSSSEQA